MGERGKDNGEEGERKEEGRREKESKKGKGVLQSVSLLKVAKQQQSHTH